VLRAEQDGVHDPPRDQCEQPGDDQRTGENQDHDAAMIRNPVTVRHPYAEWERHQREDRWIQNELTATATIRLTKIQPSVRWGNVPFGAASWTTPSRNADMAAKA
jgi:hypothetical protein